MARLAGRRHALALAVLGALALAARARLAPPAPRGLAAPAGAFSAARALASIRALGGAGPPRPVGSPANLATVERLVGALHALGLEPEVQEAFACGHFGACARVRNVLARIGARGPKAVLLAAHHDSVPVAPGAADDLSGVAVVLEVARAVRSGAPLPRPLVLLVTDGEEAGLVGAVAFASHPWASEIGAVVNLEARGTTGPSLMFETSGAPGWIGRAVRAMPRPLVTSLAPAIYELLPNDTDLSAFARQGLPGANLAFAGGVLRYHTPEDDLAHLDPRSLQHQGENALALVRAIAGEDLEHPRPAELLYFDVLGLGVVAWRGPLPSALVAAAGVLLALGLLRARGRLRLAQAGLGLAAALAAPLLAAGLVTLGKVALRHGALASPFVAAPGAFVAAAWAAGLGAALLAGGLAARRAGAAGLFAGVASLFAILAVALALVVPGASVAATVPALACAAAGLAWAAPRTEGGRAPLLAALVAGVAAGLVLLPVALLVPDLLGVGAADAVAALVALVAFAAAPAGAAPAAEPGRAGPRAPALAAALAFALAAALAIAQARRPPWTPEGPARLTLAFHEEAGEARWVADWRHGELPAPLAAAAPFARPRERPYPWATVEPVFVAPAEPAGLAPPRVAVLSTAARGGERRVRLRLSSPRGAPVVALLLPAGAGLLAARVNGEPVSPPRRKLGRVTRGVRIVACVTTPPEGVEVELRLAGVEAADATALDLSHGLPPGGARLAGARPPGTLPSQDGDVTLVSTRVRL